MNQNFVTTFEDVRHERSFVFLLILTGPDILKQSIVTHHEISIRKKICS